MLTLRLFAALVLAYFLFPIASATTNYTQCFLDIQSGLYGQLGEDGARDNQGNPVPLANVTAISYDLCKAACGKSPTPFSWQLFSGRFSSWLLPWLALLSQLPFGAQYRMDNLMSVFLAVGSPALAAYSLVLTVLNRHWIARIFADIHYPNAQDIKRVLGCLQQAPLRVDERDGMLASMLVLQENDAWWETLSTELDYTNTWTISVAAQVAWVIIAFLFTVIVSFSDAATGSAVFGASGQSVGAGFMWLLPIVIGWLVVSPKSDFDRFKKALNSGRTQVYHAQPGQYGDPYPPAPVNAQEQTDARALGLAAYKDDSPRRDEAVSAPIYNYARFMQWTATVEYTASLLRTAGDKARDHRPVNPFSPSGWADRPDNKNDSVAPENRRGSLEQVEQYVCTNQESSRARYGRARRVDPGFTARFLIATVLAMFLQWGTVGGAIIAHWAAPPVGLGCRSGAYIVYAAAGTVSWVLLVVSSILSFYSSNATELECPRSSRRAMILAGRMATLLRRLGKLLAACNAVWIVLSCILLFTSFYDRCWCNSSVLGRGRNAYAILIPQDKDVNQVKTTWIACMLHYALLILRRRRLT
ncbi:hypothetical protein K488DRAFT_46440 [Vararia minispora EC-137]|uniref:Uncharacterized protein n=1 Tax=Vararia minispora EC-137 TaxID=1314806 RepID=A0ACB8QQ99_9AGAM|nr:hypothetical protein K488DRAFT_46440 [Vararia minispora EC-137]